MLYGSTNVQLPYYEECDNPNVSDDYYEEHMAYGFLCDETCPYYEADKKSLMEG